MTEVNPDFGTLPEEDVYNDHFCYMIKFYMDDYIALVTGRSRAQLRHIETGLMMGIHGVFPPDAKDEDYPISLRKILKKEGAWSMVKDVFGFEFDGNPGEHTIWIIEQRRDDILALLKRWIR